MSVLWKLCPAWGETRRGGTGLSTATKGTSLVLQIFLLVYELITNYHHSRNP